MTRKRIVTALVLLALCAACTRKGSQAPGGNTARRASTIPVAQPSYQTADPSLTNPRATDVHSARLGADGRTLTLSYTGGVEACWALHSVTVTYGSNDVVVAVYEGTRPVRTGEPARACITIGLSWNTRIALERPLGTRTLVDGSSGRPIAVAR